MTDHLRKNLSNDENERFDFLDTPDLSTLSDSHLIELNRLTQKKQGNETKETEKDKKKES